MSGKSKWSEESAKACLERNRVKVSGRQIDAFGHGLKIQGAVDYLCGHRGYMRCVSDRQIAEVTGEGE